MATYAPRSLPAPKSRAARARLSLPRISAAVLPTLIVAVAALAYLIARPLSLDLAAAEYRASLFGRTGFSIWDLQWYGGHYLPSYSVLVPALAWLLGARWLGVIAVIASTLLFGALVRRRDALAVAAVTSFGLGAFASLLSGRITFTAAIPVALAALLIDQRWGRRPAAGAASMALSALTAMFSPVASIFLAVAWSALFLTRPRVFHVAALAATFAPILVLNLAFPESGFEPMVIGEVLPVAVYAAAMMALTERRDRTVRIGILLYLAGCVLTALLPTPLGSNVLRLGPLCGAALALLTVAPRRRLLLVAMAIPLIYWQWSPAIRDASEATGDPSTSASFYRPLLGYLDRVSGPEGQAADGGFRVEIPFTKLHWETRWVAPHYALARGWERNEDTAVNPLFYRAHLTAAEYDSWLHANAVRYVALPDTSLDYSAQQERRIIDSHPRFLRPVWSSRHWQVFAVTRPTALTSGPGHLVSLSSEAIAIAMPAGASELIRVHWNPYWSIQRGSGCVSEAGPWTRVSEARAGVVRLGERFSLSRIGSDAPRCASGRRDGARRVRRRGPEPPPNGRSRCARRAAACAAPPGRVTPPSAG
jgi:hypothetical protein